MSLTRELMGDKSKIEWTDATWNPIRARNKATGGVGHFCEKVSAGCKHCYAERMQPRFKNAIAYGPQSLEQVELFLDEEVLLQPLRWKRPRMIFVGSMTDLFGHWVPDAWLDRIWAVMALCPQHTFQVVTKRPERMAGYLNGPPYAESRIHAHVFSFGRDVNMASSAWPLPNVWLLTSVEDQATANARIPHLLECPAVVRGLSVEPLLGPVDLSQVLHPSTLSTNAAGYVEGYGISRYSSPNAKSKLDWVIVGGESGPKARPMHPEWVRSLRDQCAQAGVAFFFKQWGRWAPWVTGHITSLKDSRKHPGDFRDHYGARVRIVQPNGKRRDDMLWVPGDAAMCEWVGVKPDRKLDGVEHNGVPTKHLPS